MRHCGAGGAAAPEVRDRQLLVDGSLIDNLPVATMAALGEVQG